ncbi:MAG: MBL fold metallo-hydrolase [Phycisphaerae bacterium]|nr:MBL fold metallo-hydrolase [Phycisphaerae bacterium]
MLTFSLQSGSNGNCIYVEAGDVRLLFDAGISGRQAEQRMAVHGRGIRDVTALILSHEHADHVRCAGIFQRKFGLPIYATTPTWRAVLRQPVSIGVVDDVRHFEGGGRIEFGDVIVHSVRTPHDAVDGCGFIVEHEGRRLGILTDLGHPFGSLCRLMGELDAAYLESNYDPERLAAGPYPPQLQARIRGNRGHLSNDEAGHLVRPHTTGRLRWVALAHLSEQNNDPGLALETHRQHVGRDFPVHVASRYGVSEIRIV